MKSAHRRPTLDEIEEAADAIHQRNQLYRIREFRSDNEAPSDLLDAIDDVVGDIEAWIDPAIEISLGQEASCPGRL